MKSVETLPPINQVETKSVETLLNLTNKMFTSWKEQEKIYINQLKIRF